MKKLLLVFAALMAVFTQSAVAAPTTIGYSRSSPVDWGTASASKATKTFKTYYEWDADFSEWNEFSYVYVAKIKVPYGKPFTIWSTSRNCWSMEINSLDTDIAYYSGMDNVGPDWDGNQRYKVWWSENDAEYATVPFLIVIQSDNLEDSVTICYQLEDVNDASIPVGDAENPERITPSCDGTDSYPRTMPNDPYGSKQSDYSFLAYLESSHSYLFEGVSGTATYPLSLQVYAGEDIVTNPVVSVISVTNSYNDAVRITPLQTGYYNLSVHTWNTTFTIRSTGKSGRLPSEHDSTVLVPGETTRFTPGHIISPGSGYVDDIIDECLFRFTAKGGDTYRLTTTGASTNLLMRLYDANGQTLLEEQAKSAFDGNIFSVFSIEEAGVYYIGVCEHLADDASGTPTGRPASVLLENVTGDTSLWDEWDDADDVAEGATVLNPLRTAVDDSPSALGAETSGPHRLSATDREDWFSFAARTDFVYRVQIVATEGRFDCPDWSFGLTVTDPEGKETLLLPDSSSGIVRIAPTALGTFSMRVSVVRTGDSREISGAASPDYTVAMTAYAADADEYGEITMMPKGPGAESDVKWRLAGTTAWYQAGAFVLAKGTVTIEAGAVDGFSTPDAFEARVLPGASTAVVATYNDVFDPDDDVADGAAEITVSNTLQLFPRTMWGSATAVDAADWFAFNVAEGVYYEFSLESITPASAESYSGLEMELFDSSGVLLAASTNSISWGAPANGACRLVVHAANPDDLCCGLEPIADCSYVLTAYSVDVGSIKIKYPEIDLTDVDDTAEVVVYRTASEGTVRVDYGTVGATAVAGVDYEAASGTLEWQDGDASEKTISVRLVPSLLPTSGGERMFYVRLWPADADEGYPAVVAAPQAATVRVVPSAAGESAGMLSFTGWGCPADVFEDPDHPEITVAPGDDVRLWVSRIGGSNGVAVVEATVYGSVGDWYEVTASRASWRHGDMGDKFIGLRIGEDVPVGVSTIYVRMDVTDGTGATVGSRRVVVHVDSSRARAKSNEDDDALAALSAFSGKYSVALVVESGTGPSAGVPCGYMSFEIGADLAVSVHGALPDGTDVDEVAEASFSGDALAPSAGVVQIAFNGESAFSGSLAVSIQDGVPVVLSEGGALFAHDAAESPLVPVGGLWEPAVDLRALFAGKSLELTTVDRNFAVEPLAHGFKASGVSMTLDADSGVLSLGNDGAGVCLQHADSLHFSWPVVAFGGFGGRNGFLLVSEDSGIESDEFRAEELPVAVMFDGNGNTAGEILGEAIIETFAGSYDVAPYVSDDFGRDGFVFIGWMSTMSGEIVAPGGLFKAGAVSETFVAAWHEPGDADIAAAVGDPGLEFHTFGDVLWSVDNNGGTDGGPAARSGYIFPSQSSTLVADTVGSGLLTFDWKASCDIESYARCLFSTNDVEVARVSGTMSNWTNVTIAVASGVRLSWKYELFNGAYTNGNGIANAVWVDNVSFAVAGDTVPVKFVCGEGATCSVTTTVAAVGSPFGELPVPESSTRRFVGWTMDGEAVTAETVVPDVDCVLVAQWDYFVWTVSFDANGADNPAVTPVPVSNYEHQVVHIPGVNGLVKAGYAFGGWSDGIGGIWNDEDYEVMATNIMLKALWSLDIGESVFGPGATSFAFDTSGDAEWFVTSAKAYDAGGTSMCSGAIGTGAESVLTATAKSSGTLSFQWACSCDEPRYAALIFKVNGTEMYRIGNETEWTPVEIDVNAGDVLTWTYWKASNAYVVGSDCAWVDALSFGRKTTVTFVAEGGDPATTNVVAFAGEPIGELPYPTWTDFSLDHWADPTGGVVTAAWIVPEEAVTLTAVTKAKEWRVTYDLAGGSAVTVSNESYVAGASFALPDAVSAAKDGYALTGWTDGAATYAPGEVRTVPGGADLAFTAVWQPDYALALDCKGSGLAFRSGGDAEWTVQSDKTLSGSAALRSGVIGGSASMADSDCLSWIEATVVGAGTLAFDWAVSCDDGVVGTKYAWAACTLDGKDAAEPIYGTKDESWHPVTLTLGDGEHVIRWTFAKIRQAYNKSSGSAGEDCAWLDHIVWTPAVPPVYTVTVNWATDAGVLGARYSIEDGDQNVEATNGVAIAVPDGKTISVVGIADSNNWYYVSSGEGTFDSEGATAIVAAKRDPATPAAAAEVGLAGAFGDANAAEVSKVMAWAQVNGKTVADVNAMTFSASGDPEGVDAEAYLLDCAPADVAAEAAGFKVTSFAVGSDGSISIEPADGDTYGNGRVEVRYSAIPGGDYTPTKPVGNSCFIRLFLVK